MEHRQRKTHPQHYVSPALVLFFCLSSTPYIYLVIHYEIHWPDCHDDQGTMVLQTIVFMTFVLIAHITHTRMRTDLHLQGPRMFATPHRFFKFAEQSYKFIGLLFLVSLVGFGLTIWKMMGFHTAVGSIVLRGLVCFFLTFLKILSPTNFSSKVLR